MKWPHGIALVVGVAFFAAVAVASSADEPARPEAAADSAAAVVAESAWPERWGFPGQHTRGLLVSTGQSLLSLRPGRVPGRGGVKVDTRADRDDVAAFLAAAGVPADGVETELERGGAYIFWSLQEPAPGSKPEVLMFISGRSVPSEVDGPKRVAIQRTWFALYEPAGRQRRGIALVVPGMFGTPRPVVDGLVNTLRAHGWAVLRMLSHPSRFTERLELSVDPASPESAAAAAAVEFSDRAAEAAYAAEAAFEWIERERPALASGPRVAVGMSGGAMALPTIVAREPEKYDAAVLIAGGVNFLSIVCSSNYTDMIDSVRAVWSGGEPNAAQRRAFEAAYLELASLDAFHTAPTLRGKPLLVLHAENDLAVPSRLGDELWERLGKPERWSYPLGHELLFMMLPTKYEEIADWLDAAAETTAAIAPGAAQP